MNKIKVAIITSAILAVGAVGMLSTGCVTSKVVTPASTNALTGVVIGATTNTIVNTNNLLIDASVFQGVVATAVSVVVQKDTNAIPILKDAQMALDGILNGANTNTVGNIIAVLGKNSNPTIASEVGPLVATFSALEQNLIAKYGTSVGGQITLALTKAGLAGLTVGLAGH